MSNVDSAKVQHLAGIAIFFMIAAIALFILVWDNAHNLEPNSAVQNLLAFVVGSVSNLLGVRNGAIAASVASGNTTNDTTP